MGTSNGKISLPTALSSFVCQQWHDAQTPLRIVAITDGERTLRSDLRSVFGDNLVQFLDWYHLRKKVCELCSMLASTKASRTELKKEMLKKLFRGNVSAAIKILDDLPVRNAEMHEKLRGYLLNCSLAFFSI